MNRSLSLLLALLLAGCYTTPRQAELEWHREEGYRWAAVTLDYFGSTGFSELSPKQTGVAFEVHVTPDEIRENQMLLHGSGVATADADGDGLTDLYLAQLNGPNKLYRNTGGFRFEDITDSAGVAHSGYYSTGVLFADIDGDRDQDLVVNTMEGPIGVYLNDGSGHFNRVIQNGLGEGNGGSTLTMADIDSDGDLDLFIANNKRKRVYDIFEPEELQTGNLFKNPQGEQESGNPRYEFKEPFDQYYEVIYRRDRPARIGEVGERNKLFLNEGGGRFREVTSEPGRFINPYGGPANLKREWSLTVLFQDINGDRLPDLYVCNDYFGPDRIWINRGDGTFREMEKLAIRNFSYSSMGVAVSDINRDGSSDIFVTEMLSQTHQLRARQQISMETRPSMIKETGYQPQYMRNSLYLNRGDHTFAEIAWYSGVEATEWSWATRFVDLDLDGYEDIIVNTGFAYDSIDLDFFEDRSRSKGAVDLEEAPSLDLRNKLFRNNGDLTFTEKSTDWGFTEKDVSYGLATADFDNDGDLDLVSSRLKSKTALFENTTNKARIAVRLRGNPPNTDAIGAGIVLDGGPVPQTKQLVSGGDYLSGSDPLVVFAATPGYSGHTIAVTWPDGRESRIDSVRGNRIYEIDQPEDTGRAADPSRQEVATGTDTVFEDVSGRIGHRHHEDPFNDFSIQPLLPIRLSRLGPGLSWIDYDGDGDDDLFISSGRGSRTAVFNNNGDGTFIRQSLGEMTQPAPSDQTAILGWRTGSGTTLLTGSANYERGNLKSPSVLAYRYRDGEVSATDSLPGRFSTTGPLAAADYDGDGDLDLFAGGRFVPAHYPMNADSRLFKNENGRFVLDEANSATIGDPGLVTGALFSDIDVDGDVDLLVSREWDSLLLFENEDGMFTDATSRYGLGRYKGWWNGIATGDFNNDGRPDIVATNRGMNTPYQLDSGFPLKIYYDDFNRDGRADIIESYYDPVSRAYVPRRQMQAYESISNTLLKEVNSHRDFANATLEELLSSNLESIPSKEINTLAHMLFLNEGSRFNPMLLPAEAQFSAAFHAGTADYNNDGNEDLFLSQNFFGVPTEMPRQDAGRGLWLEGNGNGQFVPLPGRVSGVKVYGEQRGAALSDFNNDGRTDLAVSQNDTTTKLFLNRVESRGIIVRLQGTENNVSGIGSSVRITYKGGTTGPRREIQAGAGYWSQSSATQVLGIAEGKEPASLDIRWFDGTGQNIDLEPGRWTYEIFRHR